METDAESAAPGEDDLSAPHAAPEEVDDSGTGAAVALIVALLSFLLAVTFVILRHILFHA